MSFRDDYDPRDDYDYDAPARRKAYRCGGYAAYDGHCGATDCETCHPGCTADAEAAEQDEEDEQDEE